jgi:hypothetical protein
MTSVAKDCPHCGSTAAAFLLISDTNSQVSAKYWYTMARCGVCKEIILIKFFDKLLNIQTTSLVPPSEYAKNGLIEERFVAHYVYPSTATSEIPSGLPPNVKVSFAEAEEAFMRGLFTSAASCYRKSIERAVKSLHPDGKGTLNARIRQIQAQGLLPQTLIDLLDGVRVLGNESVHEEEYDPTKADCEVARHFSNLFLIYTFSLPERVSKLSSDVKE